MSTRPEPMPVLLDRQRERAALDGLLGDLRSGRGRALVAQGEAGVGKTVLLEYLAGRAAESGCRVAQAAGVQSENELVFAGLHQLCAPWPDRTERLPAPQREALRTAFGISAGSPPHRFPVGLAVLSLLSAVAGERPLVCLIDGGGVAEVDDPAGAVDGGPAGEPGRGRGGGCRGGGPGRWGLGGPARGRWWICLSLRCRLARAAVVSCEHS